MNYQKLNNTTGWIVFAVAFITYLFTVAPTASFWDCGEFIACSNELEVTHPPGAPLFLLLGRIFSLFSFGDSSRVAYMINLISVIASAFTALFTCWTTTALAKRILDKTDIWGENTKNMAIMAAGAVAGLTCTFADSIWFNAVEAEVYALSGFFTAIVVWLMLKWSERADEPDNLRWIILIAYVMGLSIGVHLLNLLTIPALALIYFFRKYEPSWKGIGITMGISIVILAFIQYGIIQYTFSIAQAFELFFTGSATRSGVMRGGMGMAMGSGTLIFAMIILSLTVFLLWFSIKKQNKLLNVAVLSYIVIMMGFSSYTIIFIRSGSNPGIDMNNPENIMTFLSYMKREQYGDRPLFYGPMYNAQPVGIEKTGMRYTIQEGKKVYIEDEEKQKYEYESSGLVLFPRMYSEAPQHYSDRDYGYASFVKEKGDIRNIKDDRPTRGEDLSFFFSYQFVHMYMRYFMWNFVGRTADEQDFGWEDGLIINNHGFDDNKAHNHYFFIPFILGIMGMIWQFSNSKREAGIVGMLFFFTGIAIILYLNQTPLQPRERDYAYASSFQTFAIWVGLGVMFLMETFYKKLKEKSLYVSGALALCAPLIMGVQNWDDHSRKGRWVDVDFAYNLLNSCAKNAILFTAGDNDTFPLWYAQEVEGIRTDVRVVNLELLISDWYIDQMKRKANDSEPLPITMNRNDYQGEKFNYYDYSSRTFRFPVNKQALIDNKIVTPEEAVSLVDTLVWNYQAEGSKGNEYILRKDSVMINIIRNVAADNWKRPVYFSNTIPQESFHGLEPYTQMEGMTHRLLPLKIQPETPRDIYTEGAIHQEKMFESVTKTFRYRELNNPSVNFDDHIRNVIISNYRNTMHRLAVSYSENINKWNKEMLFVKAGATDTLMKLGRNPEVIMKENPGKISQTQAKLRELYAFSVKTIPYEVIKPNVNYLYMNAQMLYRADLNEEAAKEFEYLKEKAFGQLAGYKAQGMKIDPRHPAYQGAVLTTQYYMETGREKEAIQLADEIEQLTGDGSVKTLLQQMKMQQK
ncbi:MAG: DUF2723 domain-containing protein [Bacteroidia bacterium]|nr:DUF2723 domain-containing protein [Bacteroidia bacterium]